MQSNILKLQRYLGFLEGISFVLLFGIAMPLKYVWDNPYWVTLFGTIHGALFVVYALYSLYAKIKLKWSFHLLMLVAIGSVLPFGTFYVDYRYLKNMKDLAK